MEMNGRENFSSQPNMPRRKIIIVILSLVLGCAAIPAFIYFCPGPMEGFWWSHKLDCMCDSHNFLHFHNGDVVMYQEEHLPPVYVGSYRKIGWNTYEFIELTSKDKAGNQKTERYVLHPGLFYTHLGQDGEHKAPWWVMLAQYFYRVRDDAKNQAVLKKAKGMEIVRYPKHDA